jgi:uncharacterized protein YoxC
LQIVLYVALGSNIVFMLGVAIALLYIKKQVDRVVRLADELKATLNPLVQVLQATTHTIGELTARAEEKWRAVEAAIETARDYGRLVNRVVERSANAVAAPVLAASRTAQVLSKGMQTFFQVLLNRTP